MNTSLLKLWSDAGYFAKGIVILLAIMSVYSLTITIQKLIKIKKSEGATRKFAPQFSRAIQEENLEKAIALADTKPAAAAVDALVVALAPGRGRKPEVVTPGLTAAVRTRLAESFSAVGATGKSGEATRIPGGPGVKAPIVVGIGIGDAAKQADAESVRRAVGEAVRSLAGTRRVAGVCRRGLATTGC